MSSPTLSPAEYNTLKTLIQQASKALSVEEQASFTNRMGHREHFADFMLRVFQRLSQIFVDGEYQSIAKQYSFYGHSDVGKRLELVRKSRQVLIECEEVLHSMQRQTQAANSTPQSWTPTKKPWDIEAQYIPGVGSKLAELLQKLGIFTAHDLLYYFPREHLNFGQRSLIRDLQVSTQATVIGIVSKLHIFQSPKNPNLHIINIQIKDESSKLTLSKFMAGKAGAYLSQNFRYQYPEGSLVIASGTVQAGRQTRYQLNNWSLEVLESKQQETDLLQISQAQRIVPIYGLTEGLKQNRLRSMIRTVLDGLLPTLPESLPQEILERFELLGLSEALQNLHFPTSEELLERAQERMAFEEFLLLQLPLARYKQQWTEEAIGTGMSRPQLPSNSDSLVSRFLNEVLPFQLTGAQHRVFNEILADLSNPRPMQRLVQGDVGSGKTVVAVLSMLIAIERGQQAALMAPTEILAEQHYQKLQAWLTGLGLKTALLIGSQKTAHRREILTGLYNGQIHVIVGTHALIQDAVEFASLGLAVVDEQHRFGVKQREKLKQKGAYDCLFMTATPIPRTMALTLYGNLDVSEIDELPPGRKPIETRIVTGKERTAMQEFVKKQLAEGRQAYIVYPLIEESEALTAKAVTKEADKIRKTYADYQVAVIHGKLTSTDKDAAMEAFRRNETQVLVGTTVIEVGVDVPNASIMIIEDAERFGLAQLHQLRGRVGRGSAQSYCFLFGAQHNERLKIMQETENGFEIARRDLELRGPGELLGTRQSGISDFGLSCLISQGHLLAKAQQLAQSIMRQDPELQNFSEEFVQRFQKLQAEVALA